MLSKIDYTAEIIRKMRKKHAKKYVLYATSDYKLINAIYEHNSDHDQLSKSCTKVHVISNITKQQISLRRGKNPEKATTT